jgi:hypothetical protein
MRIAAIDRDVATGTAADELAEIAYSATALAVWQRPLPPALRSALARLDVDTVDDIALDLVDAPLGDVLRTAGYPDEAVSPLACDMTALLDRCAALTGQDRLALRLEVVETDACRRFHADHVTLRLLCTYIGPGTQWHRLATPDAIEQVATGAVALFKGRQMLDPPTVLHRSPPIAATGERRLLLVIDPARAPTPAGG